VANMALAGVFIACDAILFAKNYTLIYKKSIYKIACFANNKPLSRNHMTRLLFATFKKFSIFDSTYLAGRMRFAGVLVGISLVYACGHMAPYSEHRGSSVEIYDISGVRYLRIPIRVVVYDLVPRTYTNAEWITIGNTPSGDHIFSLCPPSLVERNGQPYTMKGVVDLKTSEVNINLAYSTSSGNGAPYKYNGIWPIVEVKGSLPKISDTDRQRGNCR
jgi:hypothetical protein